MEANLTSPQAEENQKQFLKETNQTQALLQGNLLSSNFAKLFGREKGAKHLLKVGVSPWMEINRRN